ncbi:benzoate/H(+) symporter BenE family transporter [Nocardia albiluteola]|nr:benzoate/H(+) symporter BenE family transporter [Nocardia albiluteola]
MTVTDPQAGLSDVRAEGSAVRVGESMTPDVDILAPDTTPDASGADSELAVSRPAPSPSAASSGEFDSDDPGAVAADPGVWQPISAGIVAALVGFTSAFAVVLTGLEKVGATPAQAASGLLAVCLAQAVGMLVLSRRYRMPIALAWSTPGAALLATTGVVAGGWPAAVGAFVVTGALIVLTGYWGLLGRLIAAIPVEIAQAMLAGVLMPLCLAPVHALTASPLVVVPVIAVWLALQRFAARWAVPAAFATAAIGAGISIALGHRGLDLAAMTPRVELTVPHWSWQAMIGIAVPLYIVTMAGQNIPGTAIMNSYGYTVPWRAAMTATGVGTMLGAAAGGHAINLAAISSALSAAPSAHPDPRRRWIAVFSVGCSYLVLALAAGALVVLAAAAPKGVLETVAGLALIATFAGALTAALATAEHRLAAAATFLVAASGFAVFGIGGAFWGLLAGLLVRWVLTARRPAPTT